jgi:hypothetical protein
VWSDGRRDAAHPVPTQARPAVAHRPGGRRARPRGRHERHAHRLGASVWALLDEARTIGDLADDLAAIYDADPSHIASDIEPLLTELAQSGYVDADA